MWKILWKLISLSVALITVTSAQYHTIENIVVGRPENDNVGYNNSSDINNNKKELSDKTYAGDNGISVVEPDLTNSRSVSSRENSETNESISLSREQLQDTNELSKSSESNETQSSDETNEIPKSSEPASSESIEPETPERPESTEPDTIEHPESKESDSIEQTESKDSETTEHPESKEPDSSEQPGTGEAASVEKTSSQESPEEHPPVGISAEEIHIEDQEVQTTHGPVKGYPWPSNAEIIAFYDIPYGKFNRPFEAPVTAQSWLDVHEVTQHTTVCPQIENDAVIGDENCLSLSIFKPKDADNASVLFHVYDAYAKNCTSADPLIYGPDYLSSKGVILVLPNYRIGPMGFLCMQNETALGNAGLKDLSLALEWVKDNIQLFGGNPSNIVVSGNGAAGAYAGYLAILSRSKDYVNKVIIESGSTLSHWALDRDPLGTAYKLAEKIRTEHSDGVIFNNTFAEVALETIILEAKGMRFKPCIEHDKEPFINDTPWKILQSKEIDATFMIGSANYAGTHEAIETTADFVAQINEHFDLLLPEDLVFENDDERNEFALKLREQYFGEDNITLSDINELSLWHTDASYLSPGIRLARPLLSAGATVYLYEFAFVGSLNRELEALQMPEVSGAVRGDLAGYIFFKDGTSVDEESPEKRMIELMVDLWVSFINSGKPTAAAVEWNELKKAEDEEEEWLLISSEPELKKGIHVDRLRLWTRLYEQHFIENGSELGRGPHYFALAAALMCFVANTKSNYNSQ